MSEALIGASLFAYIQVKFADFMLTISSAGANIITVLIDIVHKVCK